MPTCTPLHLLPGTEEEQISCQVTLVRLLEKPSYSALSYEWATDTADQIIALDEKQFYIRQNLWDYLAQLRHEQLAVHLWIDGICIDQQNVEERNHQVHRMSAIYSQANLVLTWLGKDEEDYSSLLRHFRKLKIETTMKVFEKLLECMQASILSMPESFNSSTSESVLSD
jgi:Heterokaryon incompatibility protein (HET)